MTDHPIDVAEIRAALGWTQQQLADHCGTDRSTVSKWEKEPPTKGPALVLLRQLADNSKDASQAAEAGPDKTPPPSGPATLEAAE